MLKGCLSEEKGFDLCVIVLGFERKMNSYCAGMWLIEC